MTTATTNRATTYALRLQPGSSEHQREEEEEKKGGGGGGEGRRRRRRREKEEGALGNFLRPGKSTRKGRLSLKKGEEENRGREEEEEEEENGEWVEGGDMDSTDYPNNIAKVE
ncbi:hypothetical protein P167DRAFT_573362 [Morchella conica CCBAS932]|uniref:Uncharacterized protein n=1 Tax=Morchella conica CCBAS932 TaxID=1392247 RepID=A0A3N4KS43_9PEZI|nr:hypothetical protein P167DRAFT_573362 [Morchella conica CCBAS932]